MTTTTEQKKPVTIQYRAGRGGVLKEKTFPSQAALEKWIDKQEAAGKDITDVRFEVSR